MYIYPKWTSKKNLDQNLFTGDLTKTTPSGFWTGRAYLSRLFSELIPNSGMKTFNNVNPGENCVYALGFSDCKFPNNITNPYDMDLNYGLHFYKNDLGAFVEIIENGARINVSDIEAENIEYRLEFNAVGELEAKKEDVPFHNFGVVDFSQKIHAILVVETAQYTDINVQIDFDGVKSFKIFDVLNSGESLFAHPYDNPIDISLLQVLTETNVRKSSINNDSVKMYRYVPAAEDVDVDKELVEISVPYNWSTSNEFFISFLNNFSEGHTYQLVLSPSTAKIKSHTKWNNIIDDIDFYDTYSSEDFVNYVFLTLIDREALSNEMDFWSGQIDNGLSKTAFILHFVNSATYQTSGYVELEIPLDTKTCIFKIVGEVPVVQEEDLNQFFNDIYFKARNLDMLIDIDEIVHEVADVFDFEYKPTEFDPESKTYSKIPDQTKVDQGLKDTDTVLKFENSKIIEELFIREYLPEYTKYLNDVNDPILSVIADAESDNLKEILFKNVVLMNYFKGNVTQIQFLVSIFGASIGYYYVSVDPDPYRNFVYRVSTTLPEKFWHDDIKEITHPLGWDDFYIYVPDDLNSWHQMKIMTVEDFEENWEYYAKTPPVSYLDIADFQTEEGTVKRFGNFHQNAIYDDLSDFHEFPFKEQTYSALVEYNSTIKVSSEEGLYHDLRTNFRTITENGLDDLVIAGEKPLFKYRYFGKFWELEFLKSGIAHEYIWKVHRNSQLYSIIKTNVPKLRYKTDENYSYRVDLVLRFNNMQIKVFNFLLNKHKHIKLINGYEKNRADITTFLDQSVDQTADLFSALIADDSNSEREYFVHDGKTEFEYNLTDINNLITNNSEIIRTGNTLSISLAFDNSLLEVFTGFRWLVKNGGGDSLFDVSTLTPKVNLSLTGISVESYAYINEEEFIGPTITF